VIFRRKSRDTDQADSEEFEDEVEVDEIEELEDLATPRPRGPWDRDETSADSDDTAYVDLGGLIIKGNADIELRLQVDEQSSSVAAVLLAGPESGLELRAFAAPRYEGIWDDIRKEIAGEVAKQGGTATEVDGEFGTELKIKVPIQLPNGKPGSQSSRIVGVDGPRWLLRGTFLGRTVEEPDPEGVVESAFRDVIVVRGGEAMKPREMIAMRMPEQPEAALGGDETDASGQSFAASDDPYRDA
jgi:Protein of unknown function (DUF3710)